MARKRLVQVVRDDLGELLQLSVDALQFGESRSRSPSACLRAVISRRIFEAPMMCPAHSAAARS